MPTKSEIAPFKIVNVELLGFKYMVQWMKDENGLTVQMPQQRPSDHAIALEVPGA